MFLCENAIYTQSAMENVLTHELIHAYDNCRIKYDPDNVKHLACTEVFVFLFPQWEKQPFIMRDMSGPGEKRSREEKLGSGICKKAKC